MHTMRERQAAGIQSRLTLLDALVRFSENDADKSTFAAALKNELHDLRLLIGSVISVITGKSEEISEERKQQAARLDELTHDADQVAQMIVTWRSGYLNCVQGYHHPS